VVGMEIARPDQQLLVVSSKGYGKRTTFEEYPTQGRGGQGVRTFTVNERRGQLVAARTVNANQQLMLISEDGIAIRTDVDSIAVQGRATMGVTLMGVGPGDTVASIASIELAERAEEKAATKGKRAAKAEAPVARAKGKPSAPARGKAAGGKKPTAKGKATAKPAAAARSRAPARGKAAAGKKPTAKGKAAAKPAAAARSRAPARGKAAAGKKPTAKGKATAKPAAAARSRTPRKQR